MDGSAFESFKTCIETTGKAVVDGFEITTDLVSFKQEKKVISEKKYLPGVIEPSYGIGRILYAVLEHSFDQRDGDENRCCMKFRPCVAPIKVGIFRLLNNSQFDHIVSDLQQLFQSAAISNKVDSTSGSVGRRYARADEIGIPFGITVDFQTLIDDTVTLRERDSMSQIRVPISHVVNLIGILTSETTSWEVLSKKYPVVVVKEDDDEQQSGDSKLKAKPSKEDESANQKISMGREVTCRGSFSRPNPPINI